MHAPPPSPRTRRPHAQRAVWLDGLCVGVFLVTILLVPLTTLKWPAGESVLAEQRYPTSFPARPGTVREVQAWPGRFEAWWNDVWSPRGWLLQQRQRLFVLELGVPPTPKLLLGHERWFFPGQEEAVLQHRGLVPLTSDDLEVWERVLEARRTTCERVGTRYVYMLVPNKFTIYDDRLPSSVAAVGPTRYEQVITWLHARSQVPLLDLRATMRSERERDEGQDFTYFPLGTHWTDRGAFAGYTRLLNELHAWFPSLSPAARDDFTWRNAPEEPGDTWAGRLYLKGRLVQQVRVASRPAAPAVRTIPWGTPQDLSFETDQPDAPSLLVFHDSNGPWIRPFLAPHFKRSFFKWTDGFDRKLVEELKPDIVVQLATEDRALARRVLPAMP